MFTHKIQQKKLQPSKATVLLKFNSNSQQLYEFAGENDRIAVLSRRDVCWTRQPSLFTIV